jgi:hypothetical protein
LHSFGCPGEIGLAVDHVDQRAGQDHLAISRRRKPTCSESARTCTRGAGHSRDVACTVVDGVMIRGGKTLWRRPATRNFGCRQVRYPTRTTCPLRGTPGCVLIPRISVVGGASGRLALGAPGGRGNVVAGMSGAGGRRRRALPRASGEGVSAGCGCGRVVRVADLICTGRTFHGSLASRTARARGERAQNRAPRRATLPGTASVLRHAPWNVPRRRFPASPPEDVLHCA